MTKAYLTIDDAPSSDFENKLDILEDMGITGVFFVEGQKLLERPKQVVKAIEQGHLIGCHSYSHSKFSSLPTHTGKQEITTTNAQIEMIYNIAGKERGRKLFRFPYGDRGGENEDEYQDHLETLGYDIPNLPEITNEQFKKEHKEKHDLLWIFNVKDYNYETAEGVIRQELSLDENGNNDINRVVETDSVEIILTHDHEGTNEMFQGILEQLSELGVEFKDLERLNHPITFNNQSCKPSSNSSGQNRR